jgi:hypothetical protein
MIRRHLHRSPTNREGFDHPRFYDLRFALRRSKESTGFPLRPIVPSFFRCISELMALRAREDRLPNPPRCLYRPGFRF